MKISDEEIAATERAVPVVRLIEQIVTYRRPGAYQFAESFPDESAAWREVSTLFRQSPVKEVREFGQAMAEVAGGLMTVDKVAQEGGPAELRNWLAALNTSLEKVRDMLQLFKAEQFCVDAADFYGDVIEGRATEASYVRLIRHYADVDSFHIIRDIRALSKYRYGSRGWLRLRTKIDRKSEKFREFCESEVSKIGHGFSRTT